MRLCAWPATRREAARRSPNGRWGRRVALGPLVALAATRDGSVVARAATSPEAIGQEQWLAARRGGHAIGALAMDLSRSSCVVVRGDLSAPRDRIECAADPSCSPGFIRSEELERCASTFSAS
jgi:hypothetical protein